MALEVSLCQRLVSAAKGIDFLYYWRIYRSPVLLLGRVDRHGTRSCTLLIVFVGPPTRPWSAENMFAGPAPAVGRDLDSAEDPREAPTAA